MNNLPNSTPDLSRTTLGYVKPNLEVLGKVNSETLTAANPGDDGTGAGTADS